MAKPTASFNGYDLATYVPGLIVIAHNPYKFPNRKLNVQKIGNTDRSALTSAYYEDKKINVTVEIGRDTRELLDDSIDALNLILQEEEAALITNYGSGSRQWTATLSNIGYSDVKGGHATLDLEFEMADPIGTATASTPLFSNTVTDNTTGGSFIVAGTAKWQKPLITITYSALTGGTNKTVTVSNGSTGQAVSVTRTWTAADVLIIDATTGKVSVNGTEVAFSGAIPEWKPGTGTLVYTDNLTTRTRATNALYYKRYA